MKTNGAIIEDEWTQKGALNVKMAGAGSADAQVRVRAGRRPRGRLCTLPPGLHIESPFYLHRGASFIGTQNMFAH